MQVAWLTWLLVCCCAEGCPTLTNMLVIIVGGIPIAMPTVLSVTLALGAYKLAKEGAIVARMSAVEEMAGMDILCSDKTGARSLPEHTGMLHIHRSRGGTECSVDLWEVRSFIMSLRNPFA